MKLDKSCLVLIFGVFFPKERIYKLKVKSLQVINKRPTCLWIEVTAFRYLPCWATPGVLWYNVTAISKVSAVKSWSQTIFIIFLFCRHNTECIKTFSNFHLFLLSLTTDLKIFQKGMLASSSHFRSWCMLMSSVGGREACFDMLWPGTWI